MIKSTIKPQTEHTVSSRPWLFRPRPLTFLMLLLLGVQFFVGIVTNLYVQVPAQHPGTNAGEYFSGVVQGVGWAVTQGPLALQIHAILGLLLLLTALLLIVVAYTTRGRVWKIVTPIGAVGILGAGFNGASFINYGHDFSSLLMASGFLIALVAYMFGIYFSQRSH